MPTKGTKPSSGVAVRDVSCLAHVVLEILRLRAERTYSRTCNNAFHSTSPPIKCSKPAVSVRASCEGEGLAHWQRRSASRRRRARSPSSSWEWWQPCPFRVVLARRCLDPNRVSSYPSKGTTLRLGGLQASQRALPSLRHVGVATLLRQNSRQHPSQ